MKIWSVQEPDLQKLALVYCRVPYDYQRKSLLFTVVFPGPGTTTEHTRDIFTDTHLLV